MPNTIQNCDCKHPYQDSKYGEGRRVHVLIGSAKSPDKGATCTVCAKIKLKGGEVKKTK